MAGVTQGSKYPIFMTPSTGKRGAGGEGHHVFEKRCGGGEMGLGFVGFKGYADFAVTAGDEEVDFTSGDRNGCFGESVLGG